MADNIKDLQEKNEEIQNNNKQCYNIAWTCFMRSGQEYEAW